MYGKQEIRAFLDEKGFAYEWVEHKAVYTIDEMEALGLEDMEDIAKNLFLRDQKGKRHFLIVIRANKQANLKELGEKLGIGRLSFASEERLEKYMKLKKGSVTPLGVLNDETCAVEVFFDEDFLKMKKIGVHPNENTASVYLETEDLLQIIRQHGNPLEIVSFA
ncbi:MAG: prolyl-tRNA synthetase associated domain-containing protein [Bacteroidales bacterium]|nr:YbaK/EbsC family protein [Anaerotignum sp.]MCI5679473.1 prolyl-tRNA synthetase associated domain-containing protein [Bacteroidales bacterium]MDY3927045.1 prolyl-tRNA synthetase associated domain-containing protein [Anaerotignum sp.]